ncbi:DUF4932 domain-containing protein [Flavobacterium sp. LC2016-23]|uniref:DUF4932 domain-containing protein n=1 Tax=Flavobacterium sp. LC2016-23 TaxID=2666330 RepID=UPI0012AEE7C4|nr:DUF4932 domain-containing protein [Flavobacterium sp. LC2016-23]MRX41008.1 DUF4932 domain-containing protein [Flavobacterium sp. LC2016-23]
MKNIVIFFLSLFFLNSCTSTKNWHSTQTDIKWQADFDELTGKEHLFFKKQPNRLVYLSSQLKYTLGELSLKDGREILADNLTITHKKIKLDHNRKLNITGNKARGSFILEYPVYAIKQVNVNFNKNIELLALCYFFTIYEDIVAIPETQTIEIDGKQVKVKDLYSLNIKIANEFIPYLKSKNLSIIRSYFEKDFYLHYSNFLLSIDSFPHAFVTSDTQFVKRFETIDDAKIFVKAMNDFYTEINFDQFLDKYKLYYNTMITEVTKNLPAENFITEMEHFYGKRIQNYNLYPSLTMPFSQGFAVGSSDMIGNIFGSFNIPKEIDNNSNPDLGFKNNVALRTLCVHEFGHSFINPVIDQIDDKHIKATEKLFEPIKEKMFAQGYNEWKICLYEHFVRAGEIVIAKLLGDDNKAQEIMNDNVTNRSFIYLPQIAEKLEYWYYNEFFTKTYPQKVDEIISELN